MGENANNEFGLDTGVLNNVNNFAEMGQAVKKPFNIAKILGWGVGLPAVLMGVFAMSPQGKKFLGSLDYALDNWSNGKGWNFADARSMYEKYGPLKDKPTDNTQIASTDGGQQQASLTVIDKTDPEKVQLLMHDANGKDFNLFAKYDATNQKLTVYDALAQEGSILKDYLDKDKVVDISNITLPEPKNGLPIELLPQIKSKMGIA